MNQECQIAASEPHRDVVADISPQDCQLVDQIETPASFDLRCMSQLRHLWCLLRKGETVRPYGSDYVALIKGA
ncbi:hypothetical protein PROFUN_09320 [Planoprotostelium fungivorum]|uniref:Uncharacterized protein n=1 Tax=Planoprotostelium fungivorum TaxID=1890364 RepID=A0A2P6NHB2_9EUKA|nr:hypothetical protein PROFUN_09320 [Planoprotostelium fungivorum]